MKCAIVGCFETGMHRIYELVGREYCTEHYKIAARKIATIRRAQRAIERRNEAEDNSPARVGPEM
jgi:hypothetical protein